jgi:RNA polymerase sigma-70 factor (ECF subfamily)
MVATVHHYPDAALALGIESLRPQVEAVVRHMLGRADDAEDVVQEALVRIYTRVGYVRHPESLDYWAARVARTVCLNWVRKRRDAAADPMVTCDMPDRRSDVEGLVLHRETVRSVAALLEALPAAYAEPLRMLVVDGLSYEAIASRLGVPLGTVKGRLHRGRRLLTSGSRGARLRAVLGEESGRLTAAA